MARTSPSLFYCFFCFAFFLRTFFFTSTAETETWRAMGAGGGRGVSLCEVVKVVMEGVQWEVVEGGSREVFLSEE